ncbi:unnamed protein product [Spirodela intermedia]|uniref:Myb-like domain-containing protein n=1 Tax=Spirodela intermedia TaxID=51605 RepID=A0A7I8IN86_SPIIN|nr:unnamed protein product [Spirodela intermedia]CAA6659437.1 unnamed protein product [Spirodela intermedia]
MGTSGRGLKVEIVNGDGRERKREKERIKCRPSTDSSNHPFEDEAGSDEPEECLSSAVKRKKKRISAAPRTKKGGEKKVRQTKELQEGFSPQRGCGESSSGSSGWTYEQEMALRRAYLLAKPSPQFWKKISKMVPGRSAQECFDRMHSKLTTPAQLPPRSRVKLPADLSPLPCGDLRRKDHLGSKAVRHMLRKHSVVDQAQEVDLFSVLETSQNAFPQVPRIPSEKEPMTDSPRLVQGKGGDLSGGKKKILSRCSQVSPEVLRPIKNILLHERYIDQLHCREAVRRRTHCERRMHCVGLENGKENVVNSAKSALISDAREIIHQFGHSLAAPSSKFVDTDEEEEEEEVEDDA